MSIEVEMKFKLENLEDIEYFLIEHKAELLEVVNQRDHYFNHPSRDFSETDEALRIREESQTIHLTYKGPKIDSETKTRKEIEINLGNAQKMAKVLELLGFIRTLIITKERKIYRFDEILFCLDNVESLGYFLEVEMLIGDKKQLSATKQKLFQVLEKVDIDYKTTIRKSYLELLLEKENH